MSELCVLCHANPGRPACTYCLDDLDRQLADLPRRYAALSDELTPSQAPDGERVNGGGHVHAALPVRVGALSLVGPGGDVPLTLHPLIRHWSVKRKVQVTTHVVGHARTVQVEVTDWFHEAVIGVDGRPVMVPDDDQIGVVPPREWLDMQVRRVRAHFGHHVPPRTLLRDQKSWLPPAYRLLLHVPGGPQLIGFLAATHAASGAAARLAYRGLLGENRDPSVADLERGEPPRTMRWDVQYLRTWLPKACEQDALDLPEFAAQLHAMHAEIGHVLGEVPDRTRIGRCPAFVAELDVDGEPTGRKKACGGTLWQDKGAHLSAQVQCPRCRSTWDTAGFAGAGTAREIRRVWPVDRHRRYTAADIDRLNVPKCHGCGQKVIIEWREVTGTRDGARTWQPTITSCTNGCAEARRVL